MGPRKPVGDSAVRIRSIRELSLRGKILFLRLDLNVPLAREGDDLVVADPSRIDEALPTLKFAMEAGAKTVVASHLGRPDGKRNPEFSLEPVARALADRLGRDVTLADDCVGDGVELSARALRSGDLLLLENLRFHEGEESNAAEFTHRLARLAEVYVSDAFGTTHRKHASTFGLPAVTQEKGMGFLIERELLNLEPLLENPAKPFAIILGGSKVSDKIPFVRSLLRSASVILVGGAMAHAFWRAQGREVPPGAKQPKEPEVLAAKDVLNLARGSGVRMLVPEDTVDGFDVGPRTIDAFREALAPARTVFWNGPLGWFEKPPYDASTNQIAEHLAGLDARKIVGGGDTVSAIKASGFASGFSHLSTGGGAVLEFLEGRGLPGIEVLRPGFRPT